MRVRRSAGFVAIVFVVAACAGGEVSTEVSSSIPEAVTTTELLVATSTTSTTTTTTLSVDVNLATAEAVVAAIYAGDEEALDDLPWSDPDGRAKDDAVGVALFEAALNVSVLTSSCEDETAQVVTCQTQASDDLSDALGIGVFTDSHEISFDDSGGIFWLMSETEDGGVGGVFTNWAWGIAYPGICDSPAQCAEALLGVVDEYNETYAGAVVASYIAAYNVADIDRVMALFTEESVITGHPADPLSTGLTEILALHVEDINDAATEYAYTISNVEVTDDTVTWDHLWVSEDGNEFCKFGHVAVIEDGQFVSWTWPGGGFDCP